MRARVIKNQLFSDIKFFGHHIRKFSPMIFNIILKVIIKNEDYNFYRYMYEFSQPIKLIVILKI